MQLRLLSIILLFTWCSLLGSDYSEEQKKQFSKVSKAWALLEEGNTSQAEPIFTSLLKDPEPIGIRNASIQGLFEIKSRSATFIASQLEQKTDLHLRRNIIRLVSKLPATYDNGIELLKHSSLHDSEKIALIELLSKRGDSSIAPYLAKSLDHDEGELMQASLKALGFVGQASHIPEMLHFTDNPDKEIITLAIEAIARMKGATVDQALIKHLDDPGTPHQIQILEILGLRNTKSATNRILEFTQNPDKATRLEAIKTFATIASYKYLDQSLENLTNADDPEVIREWSRVILTLAERSPDITKTIRHLEMYAQRYPHTEKTISNILRRLRS